MSSPFGPTGSVPGLPNEPAAEELVIGDKPRGRRGTTTAIALIAGGALAGGILASTVGASASSSTTAADAAVSSSASAPSSPAPGTKKVRPNFVAPLTGKVTAVGTDSVTIATTATGSAASTTNTYSVTSTTRISINESGPGALTGVKVGDTVSFSTTTSGGTVLADLRDGAGPFGGGFGGGPGPGGPGGPAFGNFAGVRPLTGTVTAVGTDTVGIKTSTATTTYSVTSTTRIEKDGKATLTDVKVGDTVLLITTTTGGTVLANLIDGKLPTVAGIGGQGFGPGGPGGRMGHGPGPQTQASPSAGASTAATNT
jgi:co-chaperonin GroES (HSP10)